MNICQGWALIIIGVLGLIVSGISKFQKAKLLSFNDSLSKAKIVWGLWITGGGIYDKQTIKSPKITRVLLASKGRTGVKTSTIITGHANSKVANAEIDEIGKQLGNKVKYYPDSIGYSFTIFDKTPINNNAEPCSKNAWVVVQILEPKIPHQDRTKYVLKNKGKDSKKFEGFYGLFKEIWEEAD